MDMWCGIPQVRVNIMKTWGQKVAQITTQFRDRQKHYLMSLKGRNEFAKQFFPDEDDGVMGGSALDAAFTEEQMQRLQEAEQDADQRTQQVINIAKNVQELATIMHEMQILVTEQVHTSHTHTLTHTGSMCCLPVVQHLAVSLCRIFCCGCGFLLSLVAVIVVWEVSVVGLEAFRVLCWTESITMWSMR
jgi:hypothetical protein